MKFNDTTRKHYSVLMLMITCLMLSCKEDPEPDPVAITGFSPVAAFAGETVTITGNHFSTTPSDNTVQFNGVVAEVSTATLTSLAVKVPETATSGKVSVTVKNKTATSSDDFTVLQTTVTGFAPISGTVGTAVTINGTNFSPTAANNSVKFNGVVAVVAAVSASTITANVPDGATTGKIQ